MRSHQTPICVACKHFGGNLKFPRCKAIKYENRVTGIRIDADCHPERTTGTKCGPEGKLFARVGS